MNSFDDSLRQLRDDSQSWLDREYEGILLNNRFRVLRYVDKGGMGRVYEAEDRGLEKIEDGRFPPRAVKFIRTDRMTLSGIESFKREASILSQLVGVAEGVLDIHSFGEHNGEWYIVTEYVPGLKPENHLQPCRHLGDLLQSNGGPLRARDAVEIVRRCAATMDAIHRWKAGIQPPIVHRDLKPSNILLVRDESDGWLHLRTKISDFGLATPIGDSEEIVGTPGYMAPEQCNPNGPLGSVAASSDIWALGVILVELMTGQRPYEPSGATSEEQFASQSCDFETLLLTNSDSVSVRNIRDPDLREICRRCLQLDPKHRYQPAGTVIAGSDHPHEGEPLRHQTSELTEALNRWLKYDPLKPPLGRTSPGRRAWLFARRNAVATIVSILLLVTCISALMIHSARQAVDKLNTNIAVQNVAHYEKLALNMIESGKPLDALPYLAESVTLRANAGISQTLPEALCENILGSHPPQLKCVGRVNVKQPWRELAVPSRLDVGNEHFLVKWHAQLPQLWNWKTNEFSEIRFDSNLAMDACVTTYKGEPAIVLDEGHSLHICKLPNLNLISSVVVPSHVSPKSGEKIEVENYEIIGVDEGIVAIGINCRQLCVIRAFGSDEIFPPLRSQNMSPWGKFRRVQFTANGGFLLDCSDEFTSLKPDMPNGVEPERDSSDRYLGTYVGKIGGKQSAIDFNGDGLLCICQSGVHVAYRDAAGTLHLANLESQNDIPIASSTDPTCVEFSPDSKKFVVGGTSGIVTLLSTGSKQFMSGEIMGQKALDQPLRMAVFSRDSQKLALATWDEGEGDDVHSVVRVLHAESSASAMPLALVTPPLPHGVKIGGLDFDPSGRFLFVSGANGVLRVWDLAMPLGSFAKSGAAKDVSRIAKLYGSRVVVDGIPQLLDGDEYLSAWKMRDD